MPNKSVNHAVIEVLEIKDILVRLSINWKEIDVTQDASNLHTRKPFVVPGDGKTLSVQISIPVPKRGGEVSEDEDNEESNHPLVTAIEIIKGWTGEKWDDLWEAALRVNSDFGLDARIKRDGTKLPNLSYLLPILQRLDSDGYNVRLLVRLFREHPDEMQKLGFDKPVIDPPVLADAAWDKVGQADREPNSDAAKRTKNLPPRIERAGEQYNWCVDVLSEKDNSMKAPTDDEIYTYLENAVSEVEKLGRQVPEVLESLGRRDNWKRYLSEYRKITRTHKNTPPLGRDENSGSVVRLEQV